MHMPQRTGRACARRIWGGQHGRGDEAPVPALGAKDGAMDGTAEDDSEDDMEDDVSGRRAGESEGRGLGAAQAAGRRARCAQRACALSFWAFYA